MWQWIKFESAAIALLFLILGGVTVTYFQVRSLLDDDDPPLEVRSISAVGPFSEGGDLTYHRTICNVSDETVTAGVQRRIISLDGDIEIIITQTSTTEIAPHECDERDRKFPLPDGVTAGMWQLRLVISTSFTSPFLSATTEPFEVIEESEPFSVIEGNVE
jgi:hypothetical protein